MLHLLGYIGAILIGISLGLIGGGGAILTVPVLLYIFGESPETATGYSMFIVGITSLAGAFTYIKNKMVDMRITVIFGIPAVIVGFAARIILSILPKTFFTVGSYNVTKEVTLVILFAILMLLASYFMITDKDYSKEINKDTSPIKKNIILVFLGTIIGLLGGLLGVGGGFLIVPTLVIFEALPIKKAIGTSLLIISVNLLSMFSIIVAGSRIAVLLGLKKAMVLSSQNIEWPFLLLFTALAVSGIVMGSFFAKHIPGKKLKPAFGVFILCMGIYIIAKELIK